MFDSPVPNLFGPRVAHACVPMTSFVGLKGGIPIPAKKPKGEKNLRER